LQLATAVASVAAAAGVDDDDGRDDATNDGTV